MSRRASKTTHRNLRNESDVRLYRPKRFLMQVPKMRIDLLMTRPVPQRLFRLQCFGSRCRLRFATREGAEFDSGHRDRRNPYTK